MKTVIILNFISIGLLLFVIYKLRQPISTQKDEPMPFPKPSMKPFAKKGKLKPKVMDDQALWKKEQEENRG